MNRIGHSPNRTTKTAPDSDDKTVFFMLSRGERLTDIGRALNISVQSVHRRIEWCKARRWTTNAGKRLLSESERTHLLQMERLAFEGA